MDSTRRTALVAGLFYLITFAASIPAVFLLAPVLNHAGYIAGPVRTRACSGVASSTWSTPWPASAPPWRCSRWSGGKTKRPRSALSPCPAAIGAGSKRYYCVAAQLP
jgi:hypothetical protein